MAEVGTERIVTNPARAEVAPDNASVLVVDDDATVCEALVRVLKNHGYRVAKAANGQDALRLLDQESFDVALVDVVMPGIQGPELVPLLFLGKLRTLGRTSAR